MWVVAKIKSGQINIFKKKMQEMLYGEVQFYYPEVLVEKYDFNKKKNKLVNLLGTYIFCYNKNFTEKFLLKLRFLKGLKYFLSHSFINQKEIVTFINMCKSFENKDGFLTSNFFLNFNSKSFKFINGPLSSLFFNILKVDKNKIVAELSNKTKITINKFDNCQFLNI